MSYTHAIILGIVQGLAEFLPISSSGHLALLQQFFGVQSDKVLMFTVMLHIGTLVSVFIMYWHDIWQLLKELVLLFVDLFKGRGLRINERPYRKLGIMIIVATIPTGIIGVLFNNFFESLYSSMIPIGIGFIITGLLLYFSEKIGKANRDLDKMNYRNAIFIGVLQGIAICPGISRSGSTMVGGLFSNLNRDFAVRFAFLISIPAILGSAVLEIPKALNAASVPGTMGPMLVGTAVAAVCGILAIKAMINVVAKQKLKYFSYYVWALGAFVIGYGLMSI
ncbi:MAG: undecaprenyl-diphosphatase UppP [Anaerovoracaceae bacterium]